MRSDDDFIQAIKASPLAVSTKKNYLSRLNTLKRYMGDKPIMDIVLGGEETVKAIVDHYPSAKTQKGFFIVILALFKYVDGLQEDVPKDVWRQWATSYGETNDRIEEHAMLNQPSERQREGYVPWADFKKRVYDLPSKGIDKLLVAMYSLIEPLRGDYNRVRIYKGRLPTKDREDNYLWIKAKGDMLLRIGEHKTALSYGAIETEIPDELARIIKDNLKANPRDWLFTDKNGEPLSDNNFVKLVARRFEKIYGKPLTINLVRHSYINSLDLNTLSIAERQRIARQMGHDWIRQQQYRLLFNKKDDE